MPNDLASPVRRFHPAVENHADEELLALVLGPGAATPRAAKGARSLLQSAGGLRRLSRLAPAELRALPGVGSVRAARLAALFVLARRVMSERMTTGDAFVSPRQIFDHYHARLRDWKRDQDGIWNLTRQTAVHIYFDRTGKKLTMKEMFEMQTGHCKFIRKYVLEKSKAQ